ncbi:hypothetical protein HMPREF9103_00342 [Lentilactobacillus parafarraginis F0439]|uniref:Uncharacterized protein n=1 Tax=Lentilactobacillus parafarraginis F0439 TaxID=797515 RepID=G9ZKU4_9LACO|nr:hypothetical protein HMPREF9103_00342 [Lentilactobacillus parafarraginis F0439]
MKYKNLNGPKYLLKAFQTITIYRNTKKRFAKPANHFFRNVKA